MRNVLITLAAASTALVVASPASAQWYPQPQPNYGYAQPNAYGQQAQRYGRYGYNHYNQARAMQARVDHIQREISRLAQYRMITRTEYTRLQRDARDVERRLRRDSRDGFGIAPREMYDTQRRITSLEQKIARDVRDGRQWRYRW